MMTVSFSLPAPIEDRLRAALGDLDVAGKEAALVELYRQEWLSHEEFEEGLGISRDEANAILERHRVTGGLSAMEELDAQIASLRDELVQ